MTKKEFQQLHEFDDEDMERIDHLVRAVSGKIVMILNKVIDNVV